MVRLRHLVVVIPGIGGSVLERDSAPIWGAGMCNIARALVEPERLSIQAGGQVTATRLLRTPLVCPWWSPILGYDELLRQMTNAFGAEDVRDHVRPFPYDFRQSIQQSAAALESSVSGWLASVPEAERRRQVVIVAHSMGGLVARYWLGVLGRWEWCEALITMATPHRGAPKALDILANGFRLGPVPFPNVTDVLREWPSMYELLPRYKMVWDEGAAAHRYPHECQIAGLCQPRARSGFDLHCEIENAWKSVPPRHGQQGGPRVIPLLGHGHPTPESAHLEKALKVTKVAPSWLYDQAWYGDGTVPARAALPIEEGEELVAARLYPLRHSRFAAPTEAVALLRQISTGVREPVRGGETSPAPSLGVEIGELHAANVPIPIEAELRNPLPGGVPENAQVWVTVRKDGSPAPLLQQRLDQDCGTWRATVGGLPADLYRVRIEAINVPGAPPPVDEVVGVIQV